MGDQEVPYKYNFKSLSFDESVHFHTRVLQIALGVGMGHFAGGFFLLGGENLRRSDFDHSNVFQS